MALRLAGEETGVQEKIEYILYDPGLQDSGDLESATTTITVTSEASELGSADYTTTLTHSKPADARLVVKRIAARLQIARDSGTSTSLSCRVYVDVQDAAHRLFDADVQANPISATSLDSVTLFGLLTDGAAHTFYFFFWVDSGTSDVSLVQLW